MSNARWEHLGKLGEFLKRRLDSLFQRQGHIYERLRRIDAKDIPAMAAIVGEISQKGMDLEACAISLLHCHFPIQVEAREQTVRVLAEAAVASRLVRHEGAWPIRMGDKEYRQAGFPLKTDHPGATNKVNLFLSEVYDALVTEEPAHAQYVNAAIALLYGKVYDDQATGALLAGYGLSSATLPPAAAYSLAVRMVLQPEDAKIINVAVKSLGLNSTALGAMVCEGTSLLGRGVGMVDLAEETQKRVKPNMPGLAHFEDGALRAAVRSVLDEELRRPVVFNTLAEHWEGRWGWCVNGSHARLLERLRPQYAVREIPGVNQWYRRMFVEAQKTEPVADWDGRVFVSASPKLEHGKTRAILACDSVSYVAFEHLLKPVERAWEQRRVVLDPGANGHAGMASRVRELRKRGDVSIMLDYDDFNSQHTLRAQQIVFEELVEKTGYDPALGRTLVESFSKMDIYHAGAFVGTATGTLMSGHRGTTFLNSVLNAAYVRLMLGPALYEEMWALHVGDDVYLSAPSLSVASEVVRAVSDSPCRLNPSKQSVGTVTAEFLRVAIGDYAARGYLLRAIGSAVSGNWVSEWKLDAREAMSTMVQMSITLRNRSHGRDFSRLIGPSCARMTAVDVKSLIPVLRGDTALGDGPQYSFSGVRKELRMEVIEDDEDIIELMEGVPSYATDDYLSTQVSPVELHAIAEFGYSVKSAMLRSSYAKATMSGTRYEPKLGVRSTTVGVPLGSCELVAALRHRPKAGILAGYPLLQLLKGRLSEAELRVLVELAGGHIGNKPVARVAWGAETTGAVVQGYISYSDASSAGKKVDAGVIYTVTPYYV